MFYLNLYLIKCIIEKNCLTYKNVCNVQCKNEIIIAFINVRSHYLIKKNTPKTSVLGNIITIYTIYYNMQ